MNIGHLRAKIRKLTEEHEDEEIENGELNLVPYLDIVTNVIMFLMMTTTFAAALADINVTAPNRAQGGSGENQAPVNDLNLTVSISDKGFTIACAGGVMFEGCKLSPAGDFTDCKPGNPVPTLPKVNGQYDYDGLKQKMREIKSISTAKDETKVIINANPDIIYEILVNAMDAIRNDGPKVLFPDVLFAGGVT